MRCCYIRTPRGDTLLHVVSFGKHLKSLVVGVGVCDFIAASSRKHVATCEHGVLTCVKLLRSCDSVVGSIDCDVFHPENTRRVSIALFHQSQSVLDQLLIANLHHRERGAMRDCGAISSISYVSVFDFYRASLSSRVSILDCSVVAITNHEISYVVRAPAPA